MSVTSDVLKASAHIGSRHWRLWEWVNGVFARALSRRPVQEFRSARNLWQATFNDTLRDGDTLTLRGGWYLQEWVPRSPGHFWQEFDVFSIPPSALSHLIGNRDPYDSVHQQFVLPRGLPFLCNELTRCPGSRFDRDGLLTRRLNRCSGVFRPRLGSSEDFYALLSVVTADEYLIDLGFPVVVSYAVYRALVEAGLGAHSVELEGVACFRETDWSTAFSKYLLAAGARLPEGAESLLSSRVGRRQAILYIDSPLDVSIRQNDTHPEGIFRVEGVEPNPLYRSAVPDYLLTVVSNRVNPARFPTSGISEPADLLGMDLSMSAPFGFAPLTDFDGRVPRFECTLSCSSNPIFLRSVTKPLQDAIAFGRMPGDPGEGA